MDVIVPVDFPICTDIFNGKSRCGVGEAGFLEENSLKLAGLKPTLRWRAILNVKLRSLDRSPLPLRFETECQGAGGQQRPLYRVGRLAGFKEPVDTKRHSIPIGKRATYRQRIRCKERSSLAIDANRGAETDISR